MENLAVSMTKFWLHINVDDKIQYYALLCIIQYNTIQYNIMHYYYSTNNLHCSFIQMALY